MLYRKQDEWLLCGVRETIARLAIEENVRGFPHRGPITREQSCERAALLREIATKKVFAQAAIRAMARESSSGLPIMRLFDGIRGVFGFNWAALPGNRLLKTLEFGDTITDAEPGVLNNFLRWALEVASDAPFARYNMEIRQKIYGKDNLLDGRYVLVTREGVHEFDDAARCDAKEIVLYRAAKATPDQPASQPENIKPIGY